MRRAIAIALVAACNQREAPRDPPSTPPTAAPRPAPVREIVPPPDAAPIAVAPPDAPPPDAARAKTATRDDDDAHRRELEAEALKYADLLTADTGSDTAEIRSRREGTDLGAQIAALDAADKEPRIAVGTGAGRGTRGGADLRGPGAPSGPGTAIAGEPPPTGRISVASKQAVDETSLTVDMVLAKIMAAYMPGLHRCYRERLAADPNARGKVTLELTVNEVGRAVRGAAHGFDDDLDRCMTAIMTGWRFAIPKDANSEPAEAGFAITLQLVPD